MPRENAIDRAFNRQVFPYMEGLPIGSSVLSAIEISRLRDPQAPINKIIHETIEGEGLGLQDWVRGNVTYPRDAAPVAQKLIGLYYTDVSRIAVIAEKVARNEVSGEFKKGSLLGFRLTGEVLYDHLATLVTRDPAEFADYVVEEKKQHGATSTNPEISKIQRIIALGGERFKKYHLAIGSAHSPN